MAGIFGSSAAQAAPAAMAPPADPFDFAQQSALRAMGAPGQPYSPGFNAGMAQGMGPVGANMMDVAAQQLAAQGIPPPAPGSLQQMMNDPALRAMMLGAIQGTGTSEEDLARLRIAAGKQGAYAQIGQGAGGRQFEPTVPALYQQAAQRRGRPPLGRSLRGE